ncbi:hypothetical protein MKEN_00261400 [Mycena kentingensis (nom. inval.)]|nr:hypothetical protein MKEN_00261400 [Mycena kentingensis (nom. inval.)]
MAAVRLLAGIAALPHTTELATSAHYPDAPRVYRLLRPLQTHIMVSGGGLGARRVSNLNENRRGLGITPGKTIGSRIRSSFHTNTGARRKREAHTSKRLAKHKAAGKTDASSKSKSKSKKQTTVDFDVTSVGPPPETVDIEMGDAEAEKQQPSRSTKRYRLPRELKRPTVKEVTVDTLEKLEPELVQAEPIPVDYVRDMVEEMGPGLLKTAISVSVDPPKDGLPTSVRVKVNTELGAASQYPPPTHMLAVHGGARPGPASANVRRAVTLVPIHSIVFALHCTNLPPFEREPADPFLVNDATELTLPVQPLRVPHPPTFAPLMTFLYTQRPEPLTKALLPALPYTSASASAETDTTTKHAGALAQTYTPQALLTHALRVHGLWQNAVALGVHADELWDAIEDAWEVLLTAIGFATGTEIDFSASESGSATASEAGAAAPITESVASP